MKQTYFLILAAASVGLASATDTAYTTPVGYVTLTVPGQSDTTITPPLERAPLLAAASTGISGNIVSATGLTAGAFVSPECYLQVTSGALIGQRFPITANDTTSITVQVPVTSPVSTLQSLGFVSTDTFKVIPYWTLNTLFPAGAGVGTTDDVSNATSFVMASNNTSAGMNKSSAKLYFYCTGDIVNGPDGEYPAGWYDNDAVTDGTVNNTRIDLSRMYAIRTTNVAAQSVVVTAQVPDVQTVIPVAVQLGSNDVLLGSPFPVDVSLQDSGLQSAIQASTDVSNPIETIFFYNDLGTGINKSAAKVYFYCSGDLVNGPDGEYPAGWYDNDAVTDGVVPSTNKVVKAGRCLIIRKAPYGSAGTVPWIAPLPY